MDILKADLEINKDWKVGVVTSRFNELVTVPLEEGAINRLATLGFEPHQVKAISVPGAVEIPIVAKWLLDEGFDAIIALGCVIRGETTHYDYVCNSVERGCSQLALETGKPVAFGILTTEDRQQALNRVGGSKGHKGEESVDVVVELLNLKKLISS